MREKVYISGAIAHHNLENRKSVFDNAAAWLELKGYSAVNPFDNGLPQRADRSDHMKADLKMLTDCDKIYMLQGWEQSKGARLELDVACQCGIEVLFEGLANL